MILHPSVIALLLGSLLIGGMLVVAGVFGLQVLRRWDIKSGSERQLALERKTYLISTLVGYAILFQLASLFLFIYTTDSLCTLFLGAMCAAGTLHVNAYGYPALLLKIAAFLAGGVWLIINHADSRGYDYPLIRHKYAYLLALTPLILAEGIVQGLYFLTMKPHVITSCCGKLFSVADEAIAGGMATLPATPIKMTFFAGMVITAGLGIFLLARGKGGVLYGAASGALFPVSVAALISFISLYIYEMPTHHCPFCVLQGEYHRIGYLLYGSLLAGAVFGLGVGVLSRFRNILSLRDYLPLLQRRLVLVSLGGYGLFLLLSLYFMSFSDLMM